MIRFFIFTFLLNISLLNVNSSEKKNDDIPSVPKVEKPFLSSDIYNEDEEEEDDEENVDNENKENDKEKGNEENVCEENVDEEKEYEEKEYEEKEDDEKVKKENDEEKGNEEKKDEGEKLSKSIRSSNIEDDVDLIEDSDENNNCKNINDNFNANNSFNNSNNEKGNSKFDFIPDLNMPKKQENIDKNDDKESAIYDKFNINIVKGQKGIKNDKTDLSGLGRTTKKIENDTPNCCGVLKEACCG